MKMVSKFIQIEFADSSIKAADCLRDIRDATESASLNLYSRYNVQLIPLLSTSHGSALHRLHKRAQIMKKSPFSN